MKKALLTVLVVASMTAPASAQPKADLQIVKTYRPASSAGPAAFVLTVTNHGPQTAPGPIKVIDALPAGVIWGAATFAPPLSCAPDNTCTYNWPLAPGQSFTIVRPVTITTATSNVLNCASVSPPPGFNDPTYDNNRDCACMDIDPCRNIFIDLTTGVQDGVKLAPASNDFDWHPNNVIAAVTAADVDELQQLRNRQLADVAFERLQAWLCIRRRHVHAARMNTSRVWRRSDAGVKGVSGLRG